MANKKDSEQNNQSASQRTENECNDAVKIDQLIRELEQIVALLEGQDTDVDKTMELYQRGIEVAKLCNKQLNQRRGKLTVLKSETEDE